MSIVLRFAVALVLLPLQFALALVLAPLRAAILAPLRALARPLRLRAARRRITRAYRTLGVMADGVVRVRDARFAHPAVF